MLFIYRKGEDEYKDAHVWTGNYAMVGAAEDCNRHKEIYKYFERAPDCPSGSFWVY